MKTYTLTFTDNLTHDTYTLPRPAVRALIKYLRRHQRLPFIVTARVFVSAWRSGVNLMDMPDPAAR